MIADCLRKSKDETRRRLLRLLPHREIHLILDEYIFTNTDLKTVITFVGLLLVATENYNLVTLTYLTREDIRSQIPIILTCVTPDQMKAIVRCVVAQPILCNLWDLSTLVSVNSNQLEGEMRLLVEHLQILLGHPNFINDHAAERIQLID